MEVELSSPIDAPPRLETTTGVAKSGVGSEQSCAHLGPKPRAEGGDQSRLAIAAVGSTRTHAYSAGAGLQWRPSCLWPETNLSIF